MSYYKVIKQAYGNVDFSQLELEVGQNQYGIEYAEVRKYHMECITAKNPEAIILKLSELARENDLNHYVTEHNFNLLFFVQNTTVLKALIEMGVCPNHKSNRIDSGYHDRATPGASAMHYCARALWQSSLKFFMDCVDDINMLDEDGFSPLGYLDFEIRELRYSKTNTQSEILEKLEELLEAMKTKGAKVIGTL